MFNVLDVSASALVAQRTRLNAISGNIANLSTTRNERGESKPYEPRFVVFQTDPSVTGPGGAEGVRVSSVEVEHVEPVWKYQPGHPDAIRTGERQGWVAYPGLDMNREFVDALEATRAYEANLGVIEVSKSLAQQILKILA